MSGAVDKYIGVVLFLGIMFYLFRDPSGTSNILSSLSDFNRNAISALQGR